jgi:hypothetical protein
MPKPLDQILAIADEPIAVTPPRSKASVLLRWPSFAEWHELSVAHRKLDGDPPAELIARTVAICLSDADGGRRYKDEDIPELMKTSPRTLMWLYVKCWETVLRNDEKAIKDEEGNSDASRG